MKIIIEDSKGEKVYSFEVFNFDHYAKTVLDLNSLKNCVSIDSNIAEKNNGHTNQYFRDEIKIKLLK
jgi:hypothetical protein